MVVPIVVLAVLIAIVAKISGLGTGRGMLYLVLALILVAAMFIVGTIARATAGTLSSAILSSLSPWVVACLVKAWAEELEQLSWRSVVPLLAKKH
jgi:hypothetical protein